MKPYNVFFPKIVLLMIIAIMFAGCSYTMKTNDIPQLQTGSPLKSLDPKIFAFKKFETIGIDDSLVMLKKGAHKLTLEEPPAIMVATAIKKELERNGHTCIEYSPQLKADFIVEGTVYKYYLYQEMSLTTLKVIANTAAKLTISSVSSDMQPLIKNYEGEYHVSGIMVPSNIWKDILAQALLNMVKEISIDPELIAFLEK